MERTSTQLRFPTGIVLSNPDAPRIGRSRRKRRPNLILKAARIEAGLSPNDLGGLSGVTGQTIRNAERFGSTPHPRNQLAIAIALYSTPGEIFDHKAGFTR